MNFLHFDLISAKFDRRRYLGSSNLSCGREWMVLSISPGSLPPQPLSSVPSLTSPFAQSQDDGNQGQAHQPLFCQERVRQAIGKEGREHLPYADRLDTPLETAVDSKWAEAKTFVERLSPDERDSLLFEAEMTGFAFCGHVMADLDSIAGAIGAAVSLSVICW